MKELTLIIPAKNEPESLPSVLSELEKFDCNKTIIVDPSDTGTIRSIQSFKCKNSEFDDDPEVTAYLQIRDLSNKNNDEVFAFNGWMFSSSPSLTPFDHPVYDVWLVSCY